MNQLIVHSFCVFGVSSCLLGLVSCSTLKQSTGAMMQSFKKREQQALYNRVDDPIAGRSGVFGGLSNASEVKYIGELPEEEDIAWAPENPDIPIAGLEGLEIDSNEPVDAWYVDYKKALQKSRQIGKPVMIWFTNTQSSPRCTALSNELFSKSDFDHWAKEHLVRLRIDTSARGGSSSERMERSKKVKALKKRYNVLGNPSVLILSPRGSTFGKYQGYTPGDADFYWGRLKNATRSAQSDYASWKSEMEGKGYRVWHSLKGDSVFAKVTRYRNGKLWLVQPNGKKLATSVKRLSVEDQRYIEQRISDAQR